MPLSGMTNSTQNYEGALSRTPDIEYVGAKDYRYRQDDFFAANTIQAASFYAAPKGYLDKLDHIKGHVLINNARKNEEREYAAAHDYKMYKSGKQQHIKTYFGEKEAWIPSGNLSGPFVNGEETALQGVSPLDRATHFTDNLLNVSKLPDTIDTGILVKGKAYAAYKQVLEDAYNFNVKERYSISAGVSVVRGDVATKTIANTLNLAKKGDEVYFSRAFTPHSSLDRALMSAAKRGVRVNVITNSPTDRNVGDLKSQQDLRAAGVKLAYSKKIFAHLKDFSITGSENITITGSTNYTNADYKNSTADVSLVVEGAGTFSSQVKSNLKLVFDAFNKAKVVVDGRYQSSEFGFLFKTAYGSVESRSYGTIQSGSEETGYIKSTKLNEDFFDRHIGKALPKYHGFTSTYEAITGVKASDIIRQMDEAVGAPSIGHQINRALGFKLYSDGLGLVGSTVALGGRLADFLTGHYEYRRDLERHKGIKGSLHKFEAMLDKDWQQSTTYKGGPIEDSVNAAFGAVKSLVVSVVSYGAVLSIQYGLANFLDEGARKAVEPGIQKTAFQRITANSYLSKVGKEVNLLAQSLMSSGTHVDPTQAYRAAMISRGAKSGDLLAGGAKLPALLNRMRSSSAAMMEYALSPILQMVVPSEHLPSALRAGTDLIKAIGTPITMDEKGLHNLSHERARNIGGAIEKLTGHIPLELHLWIPAIRNRLGANGMAALDPDAHYPLGTSDGGARVSLASLMGDGVIKNIVAGFMQTSQRTAAAIVDPATELSRLKSEYALTRTVVELDRKLATAIRADSPTALSAVTEFMSHQRDLSEKLKHYGTGAPITSRSSGNNILSQGIFRKNLGRSALAVAGVLVGDFIFDELALKTQGADLFQQIALTRATRNSEGNITQIEFNGTVPMMLSAATAGVAGITAGHLFPTIYGASQSSSAGLRSLANSVSPELAAVKSELGSYAGTRARFNFKAAAVGATLGLIALKTAFVLGAAVLGSLFTTRGIRLDPESEIATATLLKVLNRTRRRNYDQGAEGAEEVAHRATVGSLVTRELLKQQIDRFSVSDIRANSRSAGSSFYSVALQLTNTGFVQTAVVQRTDALQQRTTYSLGIQLFASAGLGLTPNLPIGLVTQRAGRKQLLKLAELQDEALTERYGLAERNSTSMGVVQSALDMFGFLSFEPNSQIGNSLLGLGALCYISEGAKKLESVVKTYGRPAAARSETQLDIDAFGKAAKISLNIATSFIKYSTALTDFLPRVMMAGAKAALPELGGTTGVIGERFKFMRGLAQPLVKGRFAILGYALGVAMSDPYLGVEALDSSDSEVQLHPFTNPIGRLATAASMAGLVHFGAHSLGLAGSPAPNSMLSQLIPGARANQQLLHSVEANALQKSGARTGLIAGFVFAAYLGANILARTIGQFGGEVGLAETYKRVGALRLLSGVSSGDYRKGDTYATRNLVGDVIGDVLSKVPFIGKSLADLTGLYKDDPKLHMPILGTPFGVTYAQKDGSVKTYGQVSNITSDTSIGAFSKFKLGFNRDEQRIFANLERVNFDASNRPDELALQVLLGGVPRSDRMKMSDVSSYAMAALQQDGELGRAFKSKQMLRNWLGAQRSSELELHERRKALAFGFAGIWTGLTKNPLPQGRVGVNLGLTIKTVEYNNLGKEVNSGDYVSFAQANENAGYRDRNMYLPTLFQGIKDMYAAYTPQSKKHEKNAMGAGILTTVGTIAGGLIAYNTGMGLLEAVGAIEVVKFGASASRLTSDRFENAKQFYNRNRIDITLQYDEQGAPVAQLKSSGRRGVGFNHAMSLEPLGLEDVKQVRSSYIQSLSKMQEHFALNPSSINTTFGGKQTNVYDLLLAGETKVGLAGLQTRFIEKLSDITKGGILRSGMGSSDYYHALLNGQPGTTAVSFASGTVAPSEIYEPLGVYAKQLNDRAHLDIWQKREMLAAAKTQIEIAAVERHVLSLTTNSVDREGMAAAQTAAHAAEAATPELSAGLSGTFKRAASGAGALLGGYMAFGRDAYALAEGATFLIGSNSKLRKYAAHQIYTTSANLALALTLQKFVSSIFGFKEFGILSLAVTLGASFGLNYAAGKFKEGERSAGVRKFEEGITSFMSGILEAGGAAVSHMGGSIVGDFLGGLIFRPLGNKIGTIYNIESRKGIVNAGLAQMFLPDSVFKTNSYLPKMARYGGATVQIPFVMSTEYNTDLGAYYRAQNSRELMGMMNVGLNPKYASNFTLGRPDLNKDYTQNVIYGRFFDLTKQRTALSPLSNFSIGSNYRMSELLTMQIGMRAARSDYSRYGRVFRRSSQPYHDYTGQVVSGLAFGNEATRIAVNSGVNFGRPIADAYASVDRAVLDPFRRIGRGVTKMAAIGTNRLAYVAEGIFVNPISTVVGAIGGAVGRLFGGIGMVSSAAINAATIGTQEGIIERTIAFEQKLETLGIEIGEKYSGPIARLGIETLRGISTLAGAGASLILKGLDKLPSPKGINIPSLRTMPQFGSISMPALAEQKLIVGMGDSLGHAMNFLHGTMPFYLDAVQLAPSTYALKGATEEQLTRMERMRLYEQQAAAVGGVAAGLIASAFSANLLTSILVTGLSAYGAGQLGRKNASRDYDENSTKGRDLQVGLGLASLGVSAATSLISFYRRIDVYNNFTEVYTNEHDSKRARVVYDAKFTKRVQRVDLDIERFKQMPDSKYKTQRLQQLHQQRLVLRFEHNHEQAHQQAFDVAKQEFQADPSAAISQLHANSQAFTPRIEDGLRRLAETSAQDRLYESPHMDEGTYNHIVELEYQAHAKSYLATLAEAEVAGSPMRAQPEAVLNHYVNRLDRQLRRGRSMRRTPGILAPGEIGQPIERLYNPTASAAGAGTHTSPPSSQLFKGEHPTTIHYEKFAALTTSGFSRGARLVAALQTVFGLPAALYETHMHKEALENLQSTIGTANSNALDTALLARGNENVRYAYASSITGVLSSAFNNPFGLVAVALYGGLASMGANIPFTTIPLVPTFASTEIAHIYRRYMHARMRSGDYAYEAWAPTSGPLNSLRHHSFDAADRHLAHSVAGKAMGQGGKLVKDTVGYFKDRPRQSTAAKFALLTATLNYVGANVLGLRDTDLGMFDIIGDGLVYTSYKVGAYLVMKVPQVLPQVLAGLKNYLTADLERVELNGMWKYQTKQGTTGNFGSKLVLGLQDLTRSIGSLLGKAKDAVQYMANIYKLWNEPIRFSPTTGLPVEYRSAEILAQNNVATRTRYLMNAVSLPQREFTRLRGLSRRAGMLGRGILHAIEDFGINGLIPRSKLSQPGNSAGWGTGLINWFDSITVNFLHHSSQGAAPTAQKPIIAGFLSKLNKLGAAAKWLGNMVGRLAAPALKGAAVMLMLGSIYHSHGATGLGVTALTAGLAYGAYRGLKGLTIGKSISSQILQHGVFDTLLTGLALTNDTLSIAGAAVEFGRSDYTHLSRRQYQRFYTQSASGSAGIIATIELFPKLGVLRGLITASFLTLGMNYLAEQKANERAAEAASGTSAPTYVLAATDLINPAIKTTMASQELMPLFQSMLKSNAAQKLTLGLGQTGLARGWRLAAIKASRGLSTAAKARALRVFGADFLEGASSLAKSASSFAKGVGSFFGYLGTAIDVGTAAYGVNRIATAKNNAERKQGYQMTGRGVGALIGYGVAGFIGTAAEALPGPGTLAHGAFTMTGGLVGAELGERLGGMLGDLQSKFSGRKMSFDLAPVGAATFNYVFGYSAAAAEVPSTSLHDEALTLTKQVKSDAWYQGPLEAISSAANLAINSIGTQWRNFKIGIGNLNKEAKLKWGRFSSMIGGSHFIFGYHLPIAAAVSTSAGNTGGLEGSTLFTGASPSIAAVVELAKRIPVGQRDTVLKAVKGGSVFQGRTEQTIEFMSGTAASESVRGKSIKFDSNFKSFSDIVGMLETGKSSSMSSYSVSASSGNPNSGRYQITIGGADTAELSAVIKGGVKDHSPDQQDRAMVGRMFYAKLHGTAVDSGGTDFLKFIHNGYKEADFVKTLQQAGYEWETLRASGTNYTDGSVSGRTFVDRNYGSRDAGYHLMYQMFMARKKLYEEGGAKKLPDPAMPNILPVQADAILKPPTSKKMPTKLKAEAPPTHKVATIKYGAPQNTAPVVAGRHLNQPTREVAINLRTEDGQLKAKAVMQDGDTTYLSQANTPPSTRRVNGYRLLIA